MTDPNVQVELAIQRTEMALERTQLAWVRTAFAIVSAGLALDKGVQALHEADLLDGQDWLAGSHLGGVFLSSMATVSLAWATVHYAMHARKIGLASTLSRFFNPAIFLSVIVMVLGVAVVFGLLVWG